MGWDDLTGLQKIGIITGIVSFFGLILILLLVISKRRKDAAIKKARKINIQAIYS